MVRGSLLPSSFNTLISGLAIPKDISNINFKAFIINSQQLSCAIFSRNNQVRECVGLCSEAADSLPLKNSKELQTLELIFS